MKTLPTPISTGLSTNLAQFWLVKVEGSAATYYWTTQSKNLTAQSLILKDATVTVTADSGVIAKTIDGEDQVGISQIEYGVDISQGGGISSAADVEIDILNQDRKDTTILAIPNRLEYRPVTIYMGYIPAGASPTVEITTDLLQMWMGVVDDVLNFDYGHFALKCTDGTFFRHKDIPTTVIDATNYPYTSEENLGKPLPDVYGDFTQGSAAALKTALLYETVNPAPSIIVDEPGKIFLVAGHVLHTAPTGVFTPFTTTEALYYYDQGANVFGPVTSALTITTSPTWYVGFTSGIVTASYYLQAKSKGSNTSGTITDSQKMGDRSSTNYVEMDNTTKTNLYMRFTKAQMAVITENIATTIKVDLSTVGDDFIGLLKYQQDGAGLLTDGLTFTVADSNTQVTLTSSLSPAPETLISIQFGIVASGLGIAWIKSIYAYIATAKINSLTTMREVFEGQLSAFIWGREIIIRPMRTFLVPR